MGLGKLISVNQAVAVVKAGSSRAESKAGDLIIAITGCGGMKQDLEKFGLKKIDKLCITDEPSIQVLERVEE